MCKDDAREGCARGCGFPECCCSLLIVDEELVVAAKKEKGGCE